MTNNKNNLTKPTATKTTPAATTAPKTPITTPTATPEKCRVFGSMQKGVDTSGIHFKSVLELRREFGENWM